MVMRTRVETVSFGLPVRFAGLQEELPAGNYLVETDEELVEGVSFAAYRRVRVLVHLQHREGRSDLSETVWIQPGDLDAALERDSVSAMNTEKKMKKNRENIGKSKESSEKDALLTKHNIKRELAEYFIVGEYRYTNLGDAVAAAKRRETASVET